MKALLCQYSLPHWRPIRVEIDPEGKVRGRCPWCGLPVAWNPYLRGWVATNPPALSATGATPAPS